MQIWQALISGGLVTFFPGNLQALHIAAVHFNITGKTYDLANGVLKEYFV